MNTSRKETFDNHPTSWGSSAWVFLEALAFNYPEHPTSADKRRYKQYFAELTPDILPCKYCRESTKEYVKMMPIEPYLDSRQGVTLWLYKLHNLVNQKLDKSPIPFDRVVRRYEHMRAHCSKHLKGCTVPSERKCEREIQEWSSEAMQRYGGTLSPPQAVPLFSALSIPLSVILLLLYTCTR